MSVSIKCSNIFHLYFELTVLQTMSVDVSIQNATPIHHVV